SDASETSGESGGCGGGDGDGRGGDGPETDGLDGIRLAPFQLLAAEGRNLATEPHDVQLAWIDRLIEAEAAMAARPGAGRPA
ncbi:hypothetical protein GTY57_21345, partial [Streptomyces sp. SID5475]|nr:hypothetical protein [Streptomyces sp. SID5475]